MTGERDDAADEASESPASPAAQAFDLNTAAQAGAPADRGAQASRRWGRSQRDRMVAGVAAGIAEHLDLDPVLVRLAFVLGTVFLAGVGIVVYVVLWIVMPPSGSNVASGDHRRATRRRRTSGGGLIFGLLLMFVGFVALLSTIDAIEPNWDTILTGLAALLVLIGALILVQARRGLNGGLVFWGVAVSATLVIALHIDASFESGFGERHVSPATAAELNESYGHAFGSLRVDLSDLDVSPGRTERVSIGIAFGDLVVKLPENAAWRVEAEVVFGSVDLPGRAISGVASDGLETSSDWETSDRRVEIEVSAAFGSAEVR